MLIEPSIYIYVCPVWVCVAKALIVQNNFNRQNCDLVTSVSRSYSGTKTILKPVF